MATVLQSDLSIVRRAYCRVRGSVTVEVRGVAIRYSVKSLSSVLHVGIRRKLLVRLTKLANQSAH